MNVMTELGILDREAEIDDLRRKLAEAIGLLSVEMRAYRDNDHSRYTKEQRKGIADVLDNFCKSAFTTISRYNAKVAKSVMESRP